MKPILAAADLSPRGAAVQRRAAALARAMNAPLELVHVVGFFHREAAERSARARLHLAAANLRDDFGIAVRASLARGRVTACLAERSRAVDARLVVMGAGRPNGLRRLLQLSRAQSLQRRLAAPVLVVAAGGSSPHRRIVLASELAAADAALLQALQRHWPEALVHLLYVYRQPEDRVWYAELRRFAARHGLPAEVSLEAARGPVAPTLRLRARLFGADLLVLSPERSGLKALLGASVTQSVLGDPPCDVLLAPASAPLARPASPPAGTRSALR